MTDDAAEELRITDRRVSWLLALTLAVAVVLVTTTALLVPATFSARNNADQVARGNDLGTCRSEMRADIDRANSRSSILILEGLSAEAEGDHERLVALLGEVPDIQAEMRDAIDRYDAAVTRSREDPDGFLADCRNGGR